MEKGRKIEAKLLQNAMLTPKGKFLISTHRHDYVAHEEGGNYYATDGGLDYIKRSVPIPVLTRWQKLLRFIGKHEDKLTPKDMCIYSNTKFKDVRERLHRGSKGKFGDEEFTWIALKDMGTEWVEVSIKYNNKYDLGDSWQTDMYKRELEYREIKAGNKEGFIGDILNSTVK